MLHMSKRTKILTLTAVGVFFLAGFLRLVNPGGPDASGIPMASAPAILYAGLFIAWSVSIHYRITQNDIQKYLIISASLMVFWFIVREAKYHFLYEIDIVCRYLWYSYYIPMILLPAILFVTALRIGRTKTRPLWRSWNLLFVPAVIMIAGVFTNDLHQLIFRFRPGFINWGTDYTYGILYAVIINWIAVFILASLAVIFHKCHISRIKKSVWVPIICLIVCTSYLLWTFTDDFIYGEKLFQVPEMFCFMIVALCESCIQVGLIPSNIGYGDFLNASTVRAQLADKNGSIRYASENASPLTPEQIKAAGGHPVLLDKDTRLSSQPVGGGRIYWTDNLTAVNNMNDEIAEIKEQLSEYHDLLRAEAELKGRTARAAEQNRLYDVIAAVIKPQLDKLALLLDAAAPDDPRLKEKYALACVLNAYIKRRSNLELIGENMAEMQSFELVSSIRESVEYLSVYGVSCSFAWEGDGVLPAEALILTYELFEMVVEAAIPRLSGLLVNLTVLDGALLLKLSMEDTNAVIDAGWRADRVGACGGTLSVTKEDGTVFVTFRTRKGGMEP